MTFKSIGKLLGKDPTTISKEIKLHAQAHSNSFVKTDEAYPKLLKAPFVCNSCKMKNSAGYKYPRRLYTAKIAQSEYEDTLTSSREGIALNNSDFYENDRVISQRVRAGQHIYHIIESSDITLSKSSVYRYFNKGYFSASIIDLPRAVKFKPRNKKYIEYVPKGLKIGRSYTDFVLFSEENELSSHIEIDTVIGSVGGKVILTIHFTSINFMFALLLDNKSASEVSSKIIDLKDKLFNNGFSFGEIFPVILTDNGGEFSDIYSFEYDSNGILESKLFFCDPMQSSQKPYVEKNHTLFRDIIPKGTSFDDFSQDTINLIFSHINSVKRKILNGKSPYELFSFIYSDTLLNCLDISKIDENMVVQSTALQKSQDFINTFL